jgi:Fe-S oxidoreductase
MINHYTANRKVRNDDAYSPDGQMGRRPDRATLAYCQRAREAYPGTPVVAGGVEASLRRIAHYDYWSDTVRRSILLDAKADLVAFGMGERTILDITRGLAAGKTVRDLRGLRGVAYRLGASEPVPADDQTRELPSFEQVKTDPRAFCEMTRVAHLETNPHNAKRAHPAAWPRRRVVVNPPALPARPNQRWDRVYGPPVHPAGRIPAIGQPAISRLQSGREPRANQAGLLWRLSVLFIPRQRGRFIQRRLREIFPLK